MCTTNRNKIILDDFPSLENHNEVIYSILTKPPKTPPRSPRYESKLEKELMKTKKPQLCLTMGYAQVPLPPPDQFLKKGEGIKYPRKTTDHQCVKGYLPPVPKRSERPPTKERKEVNFKVMNIHKVLSMKPNLHYEPKLVDTRDGHVKVLHNSGEIPQFSLRKDFGQIPNYLRKRQRQWCRNAAVQTRIIEAKESLCKCISPEEREKILSDLKENWKERQKAFLQLPVITDTAPKILRKSKLEKELKDLEKDIQLIEDNPYIYVFDVPTFEEKDK